MAKLLKNKPCNDDLFEDRSHEKLADYAQVLKDARKKAGITQTLSY